MWPLSILFLSNILIITAASNIDDVKKERNYLINKELKTMVGNDIVLSDSEISVNQIIMDLKHNELEVGFNNPQFFNLSKHFFEYKDSVKQSKLFKLIKRMPKGALLHAHDTAVLKPDYVLELTYLDNLYVCFENEDVRLIFSEDIPDHTCGTQWQLMRDARYSSGDIDTFDNNLKKHFGIVIDNPDEVYTDVNAVWDVFAEYFMTSGLLLTYKPVWEKYFYDSLKALREDNVMYLEIRSVLPPLYDLQGNVYGSVETAESYKKVLDQFKKDYPDFYGAKLIYAPMKLVDKKTVEGYIKIAKEIKNKMPDFFAGFDLVGQEDLGYPLKDFLEELVDASDELDFFFHAGETNWYGTSSDENLFDAVVLNTKRIGHAFALVKHPALMEEVKKRNIALEVNVVSNAVLKLVADVRNHPLATFLAQGFPVVVSSDDPGLWEADPLSHDFYVTFVGVASKHADLRLLKKLALNSLYYSSYGDKDKIAHEFEIRWTKFIDSVVREYSV